jgi:hypothetical protein
MSVDHVLAQVEAVQVVEHHHVERCLGPLLLVVAHVDVLEAGAPYLSRWISHG